MSWHSFSNPMKGLENTRIRIEPRYKELLTKSVFREQSDFFRAPHGTAIASSRTSETRRVILARDLAIYVKRYHYDSWNSIWKGALRNTFLGRSRAEREFRNLALLRSAGIGAPEPIAFGEIRILHLLRTCFLITREATGAQNGCHWLSPRDPCLQIPWVRKRFLRDAGAFVATLHGSGFVDRNCHLRNFLVTEVGKRWEFQKLDSPKGKFLPRSRQRHRGQLADLATLRTETTALLSRTDSLRFFLAYKGLARLNSEAKRDVHRISRRVQRHRT